MIISGIAIVVAAVIVFAVASIGNHDISPNLTFFFVPTSIGLLVALRIKERRHRVVATPNTGDSSAG